jgi:hypothetical protein
MTPTSANPGAVVPTSGTHQSHPPSTATVFCIVCLVGTVAGGCISLNLLGEHTADVPASNWLIPTLTIVAAICCVGFFLLHQNLAPADKLFPVGLPKKVQWEIYGILCAALLKDASFSTVREAKQIQRQGDLDAHTDNISISSLSSLSRGLVGKLASKAPRSSGPRRSVGLSEPLVRLSTSSFSRGPDRFYFAAR